MKTISSLLIIGFFGFCLLDKNAQFKISNKVENLLSLKDGVLTKNFSSEEGGGTTETKSTKVRSQEVIDYYDEVVLNTEFNGKLNSEFKWTTDMKIYVDGESTEELMSELKRVVSELNSIINPIDLVFVNNRRDANMIVYFGSPEGFMKICPDADRDFLNHNYGAAIVGKNNGEMYVDIYRTDGDAQKHLLREELTQSLGLFNDSYKYPESIFYQGWTTTTEYAEIDRELIDMLYNN